MDGGCSVDIDDENDDDVGDVIDDTNGSDDDDDDDDDCEGDDDDDADDKGHDDDSAVPDGGNDKRAMTKLWWSWIMFRLYIAVIPLYRSSAMSDPGQSRCKVHGFGDTLRGSGSGVLCAIFLIVIFSCCHVGSPDSGSTGVGPPAPHRQLRFGLPPIERPSTQRVGLRSPVELRSPESEV